MADVVERIHLVDIVVVEAAVVAFEMVVVGVGKGTIVDAAKVDAIAVAVAVTHTASVAMWEEAAEGILARRRVLHCPV